MHAMKRLRSSPWRLSTGRYVAVATGTKQYRVCAVRFDVTGHQVAGNDTACLTVYEHQVEHFGAGEHLLLSVGNLAVQRRVCAEQQLL